MSRLRLPGRARTPAAAESAAFSATVAEPKRIRAIARESARRDPYGGEKGAARREYGRDETLRPAGERCGGENSGPLAAGAPVGTSGPMMAGGVAGRTSGALAEDATGGTPRPTSERRGGGTSLPAGERRGADNVTPAGGRCGGGYLWPSGDRVLQ